MGRATIILSSKADRERAVMWTRNAPEGTRLTFNASKRSIPQNDRMWAMLTELSVQLKWHGVQLTPDDWKLIFLDGLSREIRMAPNLDATGFVNLGRSSSSLSKEEMSDMMELMAAFGAEHGVEFREAA